MANQIVIKLNKERFEPILKELEGEMQGTVASNSELVAHLLWWVYQYRFEKIPRLGDRSRGQFVRTALGISPAQGVIGVTKSYREYSKTGKLPEKASQQ